MEPKIRLNHYIAQCGITSRRKADELISSGKVFINQQKITKLGTTINPQTDKVYIKSKLITPPTDYLYYLVNKPAGVVSTVSDPENRPTIMSLVPTKIRLFPVGRLDQDSQGLMILTNDGDLTYQLTHPKHQINKTYRILIDGTPNSHQLDQMKKGLRLKNYTAKPAQVKITKHQGTNTWLEITIHEGRNRQVRRMMAALGFNVLALIRIRIGPLSIKDLNDNPYLKLTPDKIAQLKASSNSI